MIYNMTGANKCTVPQNLESPPYSVLSLCSCDKFYHKLKVSLLLYLLSRLDCHLIAKP